jgi:hypothetical protein
MSGCSRGYILAQLMRGLTAMDAWANCDTVCLTRPRTCTPYMNTRLTVQALKAFLPYSSQAGDDIVMCNLHEKFSHTSFHLQNA